MTETASLLQRNERSWQTPTPEGLAVAYRRGFDAQADQITELHAELRLWRLAYLIVAVQFVVMFIAALWGWLR